MQCITYINTLVTVVSGSVFEKPLKFNISSSSRCLIASSGSQSCSYRVVRDSFNVFSVAYVIFLHALRLSYLCPGIIGGAVLALLCIVLLIMFTIYRMRKKDEGSYALDEPKKSYGFAYTRARDQEFFA